MYYLIYKVEGIDLMKEDPNEHTPTSLDAAASKAFVSQVINKTNFGRAVSVIPGLKDIKEIFDRAGEAYDDYNIDFNIRLVDTMYRKGDINQENVDQLKRLLHDDRSLTLFIGHCKDVADKSNSQAAKMILAVYAARVINSPELTGDPVSGVIIDVLSSVNDFDLIHFEQMSLYLIDHRPKERISMAFEIMSDIKGIQAHLRRKMLVDFRTSIKKFMNMGVFDLADGSPVSASNPTIKSNHYSDIIYQLCIEHHELYEPTQEEPSE